MAPLRMTNRDGRLGIMLSRGAAATLGALALATGGTAYAGVANAATGFNGTYTAVQKSVMIDPENGGQVAQPDQVSTWIVFSACSLPGCTAHIVSNSVNVLDTVFDGKQWNRELRRRTRRLVPADYGHAVVAHRGLSRVARLTAVPRSAAGGDR